MRNIIRRTLTRFFFDCPVYWAWRPSMKVNRAQIIRNAAAKSFLANKPPLIKHSVRFLILLCWPLNSLRLGFIAMKRMGNIVEEETGKGLLRQFREFMPLAWLEFIPPRFYYLFRLFEEEQMQKHNKFLFMGTFVPLFASLNTPQHIETVDNKVLFAEFCIRNNLPVPKTIAVFQNGKETGNNNWEEFVKKGEDFIVKPISGARGQGFSLYNRKSQGIYQQGDKEYDLDLLFEKLAKVSSKTPFLLQKRFRNHQGFKKFDNQYLITLRLVTYRDKAGDIRFFKGLLVIPRGKVNPVSEVWQFPINTESGEVLPLTIKPMYQEAREERSKFHQLFDTFKVPFWTEAIDLVLKGHNGLTGMWSLGWDVAICPEGPVLLETNINWGTEPFERLYGLPMTETDFGESLASLVQETSG